MITLYYSPGTSSLATHIALIEAGADFEAKATPMADQSHKTAEYLAINPEGKLPAITIDGRTLTEVAGTLFYIARAYPEAGLMPTNDPEAEAHVVSWMAYAASALHAARHLEPDESRAVWAIAEQRMAGKEWAVGNAYSIADIHIFRIFWRFNKPFELTAKDFPNLHAHCARMLARPAVQKAMTAEGIEP